MPILRDRDHGGNWVLPFLRSRPGPPGRASSDGALLSQLRIPRTYVEHLLRALRDEPEDPLDAAIY